MPRQSFSITEPNDEWLNAMVEKQEYSNKTELVNDLIRRARREQVGMDDLRNRLIRAEQSGLADASAEELLAAFREKARQDGRL